MVDSDEMATKTSKREIKTCLLIMVVFLGTSLSVRAENSNTKKSEISVNGDLMIIDRNKNIVTFTKDVSVKIDKFTLTCDKLIFHYLEPKDANDNSSMEDRISKLIADGNVILKNVNGDRSTAGHAEYEKSMHKFVLSENPKVHLGKDIFTGRTITYYLNDNTISIEKATGSIK